MADNPRDIWMRGESSKVGMGWARYILAQAAECFFGAPLEQCPLNHQVG